MTIMVEEEGGKQIIKLKLPFNVSSRTKSRSLFTFSSSARLLGRALFSEKDSVIK